MLCGTDGIQDEIGKFAESVPAYGRWFSIEPGIMSIDPHTAPSITDPHQNLILHGNR